MNARYGVVDKITFDESVHGDEVVEGLHGVRREAAAARGFPSKRRARGPAHRIAGWATAARWLLFDARRAHHARVVYSIAAAVSIVTYTIMRMPALRRRPAVMLGFGLFWARWCLAGRGPRGCNGDERSYGFACAADRVGSLRIMRSSRLRQPRRCRRGSRRSTRRPRRSRTACARRHARRAGTARTAIREITLIDSIAPDRGTERARLQRALRDDHAADRRHRERVRLPVRHPREDPVTEIVDERLRQQRGDPERDPGGDAEERGARAARVVARRAPCTSRWPRPHAVPAISHSRVRRELATTGRRHLVQEQREPARQHTGRDPVGAAAPAGGRTRDR